MLYGKLVVFLLCPPPGAILNLSNIFHALEIVENMYMCILVRLSNRIFEPKYRCDYGIVNYLLLLAEERKRASLKEIS